MKENQIILLLVLAFLIGVSFIDVKKKKVPMWTLLILLVGGIVHQIMDFQGFWLLLYDCMPGIVLLMIARITSQQIGYGDGLLVLGIGMILGIQKSILVIMFALMGSFIIASILLLCKKANRKTQIPFFPCVLAGYLMQIIVIGW